MSFFAILLVILLLPIVIVFLVVNGIIFKVRRSFEKGGKDAGNVKSHRHYGEQPLDEARETEIEYSDEDIIEAEFEEIQEDENDETK